MTRIAQSSTEDSAIFTQIIADLINGKILSLTLDQRLTLKHEVAKRTRLPKLQTLNPPKDHYPINSTAPSEKETRREQSNCQCDDCRRIAEFARGGARSL